MKKISFIFTAILIIAILYMAPIYAFEELTVSEVFENAEKYSSQGYEYLEVPEEVYENPLYSNSYKSRTLFQSSENPKTLSASDSVTIEEAGIKLREAMKNRVETLELPYITNAPIEKQVFHDISDIALKHTGVPTEGDYLKWQYGGWKASAGGYSIGNTYYYTITYTITYYTTVEQEKVVTDEVNKIIKNIDLTGSDYEIVSDIYKYICSNVTYDNYHLPDKNYKLKYTAYAALMNKTAVCQGYAVLFYRLALECGIDTRLISGLRKW